MIPPRSDREKLGPYLETIIEVGKRYQERPARLAALILRESGATWAPPYNPKGNPKGYGDHGHGCGLGQIDLRGPYGHWIRDNPDDWWEPKKHIAKIASILRDQAVYVKHAPDCPGSPVDFDRVRYAAYNCGPKMAMKGLILEGNPDFHTTGGNYSWWVWSKAIDLAIQLPELYPKDWPGV